MPKGEFVAKNAEERLLKAYWKKEGGILFTQVRVAKFGKRPRATERMIDGVRIVQTPLSKAEIRRFRGNESYFEGLLASAEEVEVIEVPRAHGRVYPINRLVIGQAVVGKHLLEMKYQDKAITATPVVVCGRGSHARDQFLERVCRERLGVKVWTPTYGFVVVPDSPGRPEAATAK